MNKKKVIEIVIDEDGTTHADAINFHGKGCDAALDALVGDLGKVVKRDKKSEYYRSDKVTVGNKNQIRG